MTTRSAATPWRRLMLRARVRRGTSRVRVAFWPVVQASIAAAVAFWASHVLLDHPFPIFAPVAVWVCLGFSQDRQLRKVVELAVGVALGVGFGEAIVHFIGRGAWQIGVIMAISALAARFVDRGALLTTQAGVQSVIVMSLPAGAGGGFGRWTDALMGGVIALAAAVFTPADPRRRPRFLGSEALMELVATSERIERGLRTGDVAYVDEALLRGRSSEGVFEDWLESARSARQATRVSPMAHRRAREIAELERQAVLSDRAMNGMRVLARRAGAVMGGEHELSGVARLVGRLADGTRVLAEAIGSGRDPAVSREYLRATAATADPHVVGAGDWQVQALVMVIRAPLVDILEAAGATPEESRDALPEL